MLLASSAGPLPLALAHWCAASLAASAAALLVTGRPFGRTLAVAAQVAVFAALAAASVALVYIGVWWRFAEVAGHTMRYAATVVSAVALMALAVARSAYRSAPMQRFFHGRPDRRELTLQMAVLCAACIAMATLNTWLFAQHAVSLVHLQPALSPAAGAIEAAIVQAFGLRAWSVAATVSSLLLTLTLVAYHRNSPASRELRLASARAQATLDEIAHAVFTTDSQGRILSANRGAEALCGQSPSRLAGDWLAHRLLPVRGQGDAARPAENTPWVPFGTGEHQLLRADGAAWPVDVASRRFVFDEQTLYAVIVRDLRAENQAAQDVRQAKVFFETTFQSAAVGMAVLDGGGRITRVNAAFCGLVGRATGELLLAPFDTLLHPDDRDGYTGHRLALAAGRAAATPIERRLLTAGAHPLWVSLAVARVGDADEAQAQYIVQAMNVDDSHRMRESLIAGEVRLANAQRIARLGDWVWELDSDEVRCSVQAWALLGLEPGARRPLPRAAFLGRVAAEDRAAVSSLLEAARHERPALSLDHRLVTRGGEVRVVQQQVEAERNGPGPVRRVVGTIQDITERKRIELELGRTQQSLRALAAHGDERVEEERKHIAREVHDELGGLVTALRMELSMLRTRLRGNADLLARADGMRELLDHTVGVVRQVASNLRPGALDLGLAAAIEWLAEDFSLRCDIPCRLQVEGGELALSDAVSTAAFRVVQESLTNVARHAGASRVRIVLRRLGATVSLAISDDGCGFDARGSPREGFGLLGMHERMRNIGGRLHLSSGATGTTIQIEFPAP